MEGVIKREEMFGLPIFEKADLHRVLDSLCTGITEVGTIHAQLTRDLRDLFM